MSEKELNRFTPRNTISKAENVSGGDMHTSFHISKAVKNLSMNPYKIKNIFLHRITLRKPIRLCSAVLICRNISNIRERSIRPLLRISI